MVLVDIALFTIVSGCLGVEIERQALVALRESLAVRPIRLKRIIRALIILSE